jgi:hypothetical protein
MAFGHPLVQAQMCTKQRGSCRGCKKSDKPAQGKPRDSSHASKPAPAPRKPQEPAGGGALAEALRRAGEKNGRPKT